MVIHVQPRCGLVRFTPRYQEMQMQNKVFSMPKVTQLIYLFQLTANYLLLTILSSHNSHLTPHTSHLTPHTSYLIPHTSYLTPHTSHLIPHSFPACAAHRFGNRREQTVIGRYFSRKLIIRIFPSGTKGRKILIISF